MRRHFLSFWGVLGLLAVVNPLAADDHFLTIGGGPAPDSNQVSLENNVLYFQRTLSQLERDTDEHVILFADGEKPEADLQFQNPERGPEDLHRLLAEIVGPANGIRFDYRSSTVPGVQGAADPDTIKRTLGDLSQRLKSDDRLILYFTGHGGRERPERSSRGRRPTAAIAADEEKPTEKSAEDKDEQESDHEDSNDAAAPEKENRSEEASPSNERRSKRPGYTGNHTHLWDHKTMTVTAWTEMLDELPQDMPVVAVMVQCYSGGFGNLIFQGGDPKNGMSSHPRCGFFSTVPDRVAAGCTPNINQAEYREYSSYFWEALSGVSRTGETVHTPDFDGDGQTSLLEAHAYTVLHADTIDIPTRTSDFFLREYSATTGKEELLTIHAPIEVLLATADPCERAVIEGLSDKFELSGGARGKEVEELIRAKQKEKREVDGEVRKQQQTVGRKRSEIKSALKKRWPEMANPWHPRVTHLLTQEADTLRAMILEHESYEGLKQAAEALAEAHAKQEQLELEIVKLERLKFWLERRALALNLPRLADEKTQQQFVGLVRLESQPL
ncbi:hypothetical protein DTL42_14055 [Bremerella cremea]|uniref:Caspase family protein n=1 Tax=Bremerella cremea TaxID=1031537 RepID=A0A368KQA8_9BACT|nr:hypothetical protein [Bremerella cremea]RCS47801.1 hypothetical protein DTL42_14055 [Bremerella cremea]